MDRLTRYDEAKIEVAILGLELAGERDLHQESLEQNRVVQHALDLALLDEERSRIRLAQANLRHRQTRPKN